MASYNVVRTSWFLDKEIHSKYNDLIKGFSCSKNKSVERYLKTSSLISTCKQEAMTSLVFDDVGFLHGFYTLTVKLLELDISKLKIKKEKERVQRVSVKKSGSVYLLPCFLLAQLGKNYSAYIKPGNRISGKDLIAFVWKDIKAAHESLGGIACYVEYENVPVLKVFYKNEGFVEIGLRTSTKTGVKLIQAIKWL